MKFFAWLCCLLWAGRKGWVWVETVVVLFGLHAFFCACVYVYMYACMCANVCAHLSLTPASILFLSERGHIFEPSLLPLNTYTCHTHGAFCFFFPLLLKTVRLVKAHLFSQSMPFRSCLNSPLSFKFKFLTTFWLQGTLYLLNLSSLSAENFLGALLKHY